MSIFIQVEQAVSDYNVLWTVFRSSAQAAADVTAAVAARIAADRSQADERTATLTAQSRDMTRPEVVRKLAQQELDRLQERIFEPTADEVAAFNSAMADAQAALRDFVSVKEKLRALFGEANQQLKTLRGDTLGNGTLDDELARRRLASEQRAFDLLGKTGLSGGRV